MKGERGVEGCQAEEYEACEEGVEEWRVNGLCMEGRVRRTS